MIHQCNMVGDKLTRLLVTKVTRTTRHRQAQDILTVIQRHIKHSPHMQDISNQQQEVIPRRPLQRVTRLVPSLATQVEDTHKPRLLHQQVIVRGLGTNNPQPLVTNHRNSQVEATKLRHQAVTRAATRVVMEAKVEVLEDTKRVRVVIKVVVIRGE